tara:strand:+ start:139 stop:420 length:282 start_codon:yes stop_codon:yes gene_type:complete
MDENGYWGDHYHYDEICSLTQVQMGEYGKISKSSYKAIQKRIDELFVDCFRDGYSLEGGEISLKDYQHLRKNGWEPKFEWQDYLNEFPERWEW